MQKIIFATRNPGKLKEIKSILADIPIKIESLLDYPYFPDVIEDGQTLEENALKKGKKIFLLTDLPAISDDTGLEVYNLNMQPGVLSARYAGENVSYEENNKKLLAELSGFPASRRRARFRCVAAYVGKYVEKTAEGICEGQIIELPRGSGGFGYDSLFVPDGYEETFAELPPDVKNRISHRAHAFEKLKYILSQHFF